MEPGTFLLILALVLLVALIVGCPFYEKEDHRKTVRKPEQTGSQLSTLLAERDRVLRSLKELEFDYYLGKIPEADYPNQRKLLIQEGVEVLKNLDKLQLSESNTGVYQRVEGDNAPQRDSLEKLSPKPNGNGRKSASLAAGSVVAAADDEIEVLLANRRRSRRDRATGFCPKCGSPHHKSDQFCPRCGAKITTMDS